MSVHFAPPYPVETASRVLHDNSLYPDRQPRRDPTWIGIVAFTFLAGVLLAWPATASDTHLDSATMAALEQREIVEADRAPAGTILSANMVDAATIYFSSAPSDPNCSQCLSFVHSSPPWLPPSHLFCFLLLPPPL